MTQSKSANITKRIVEGLEKGQLVRDVTVKGFGVRRQRGTPVYFVQTRVNGKLRWITIGPHGSPWTVHTARKEAMRLLGDVAGGRDPQAEKRRKSEEVLGKVTIAEAGPAFMQEHGPKLKERTREEYERLFKLHIVPKLGKVPLDELTRAQVVRFHSGLSNTPAAANFALAVLSKMMSWAEQTGRRPEQSNPCRGIEKFRARKLERYLSSDELVRLGEALSDAEKDNAESPYAIAAIRLLLLTGARRNEILTLRWKDIDFERQVLRLPDSKTGEKVIKLGPPSLAILASLDRVQGNPYVIIGGKEGQHLVGLQSPWERVRAKAGLEDLRLHDLRHSFASFAVAAGASLPMIGKLLGHTQPQTTARYAHLADDPVTQVNNTVSSDIAAVLLGDTVKQ